MIALANANKGEDEFGYRAEFVNLVRLAKIGRADGAAAAAIAGPLSARSPTTLVIAGLDPAIHSVTAREVAPVNGCPDQVRA